MTARFRFFGTEGGTKAIDFSKGEDVGFVVELSCLGEVGKALVEVGRLEESRCPFGSGRRKDRGVEIEKTMAIQIFAHRRHDLDAYTQYRPLTLHADPQMAVIEREVHSVILERHRVVQRC